MKIICCLSTWDCDAQEDKMIRVKSMGTADCPWISTFYKHSPHLKLGLFSCKLIPILCVRSRFIELGKAEKSEEDQCCPMGLKTGELAFCRSLVAFYK